MAIDAACAFNDAFFIITLDSQRRVMSIQSAVMIEKLA